MTTGNLKERKILQTSLESLDKEKIRLLENLKFLREDNKYLDKKKKYLDKEKELLDTENKLRDDISKFKIYCCKGSCIIRLKRKNIWGSFNVNIPSHNSLPK
jgi:hypothetical protein